MLVKLDFISLLKVENFILLELRVFLVKSIASGGKYTDPLMVHDDSLMHRTLNHILCQLNSVHALMLYLISILILFPLLLLLCGEGFKMWIS